MIAQYLYAKLHRAICTQGHLDYVGSITIDSNWLKEADIIEGQQVDVLNINNGNRLTTYAIPGEAGKGDVCLNGAAARLVNVRDRLIIVAYAAMTRQEYKDFKPKLLSFGDEPSYNFEEKSEKVIWVKEPPSYELV